MKLGSILPLSLFACLSVGALFAVLPGCGTEEEPQANGTYRIVTTTGMVADIVRRVAGERAEVVNLMGEGVDPHLYTPTRSDMAQLLEADLVFYSGLMLEGQMTDTLEQARQSRPVVAVTESIDKRYLLDHAEYANQPDPHVWMDVAAWSKCVEVVGDTLAEFDPEHADEYRANATAYLAQLDKLDAYVKRVIASVPEGRRVLITAHDAFGYFGRANHLKVMGIQGISTESEAGLDDINRMVKFLVDHKVGAVFVESSVSEKYVRALIEGAGSHGHTVTIGGELFSDAMGAAGTYEGTYIGMIDHNATTIARALGGEAPARGYQGKLNAAGSH